MVWSHGYYDTALWEKLLKEHLGEKILIKTARDSTSPKVFIIFYLLFKQNMMIEMKILKIQYLLILTNFAKIF